MMSTKRSASNGLLIEQIDRKRRLPRPTLLFEAHLPFVLRRHRVHLCDVGERLVRMQELRLVLNRPDLIGEPFLDELLNPNDQQLALGRDFYAVVDDPFGLEGKLELPALDNVEAIFAIVSIEAIIGWVKILILHFKPSFFLSFIC
jgi:hypothetical protein